MEPFKNLLGHKAAGKIAEALSHAHPQFSKSVFLKHIEKDLAPLELKQRMELLTHRLSLQLGRSPENFSYLIKALKTNSQDKLGLSGFLVWPLTHYVSLYGLEHIDESMLALKEMTKVFTAEFAVRPFFLKHEEKMIKIFHEWAMDENEHVRRLVSEGSRPFLPWGQKLPQFAKEPNLTWPLLEKLKNDSSKYVQKSVANHMNDISKNHANWLTKKLKNWPNDWVVKHALRTLIKQGHPSALSLIGVSRSRPKIKQIKLVTNKIKLGQKLKLELKIHNPLKKKIKVIVDIEIHFLKKNGQLSPKVFKGKIFELIAGEQKFIQLVLPLKKVTTRKYYAGQQAVQLMINGQREKKILFSLVV